MQEIKKILVQIQWRICLTSIITSITFQCILNSVIFAQAQLPKINAPVVKKNSKIESRVVQILDTYQSKGKSKALESIKEKGGKLKSGGLELEIHTKEGLTQTAIQKLKNIGVKVTAYYMYLVQVETSLDLIREISKITEINFIKIPAYAQPEVVSEGVSVMGADMWQGKGYDGTGVKIGIIDSFQGYALLLGTELPSSVITQNFGCIPPIESGSNHGTAVSEIIYDIAPKATFYLTCISSTVDFGNAIDYLISQGVNIINASLAFPNSQPCDATGGGDVTCSAIKKARDNNILPVVSASNYGDRHWGGIFKDDDADNFHEWSGTDESNKVSLVAGSPITIFLKWNDWSDTIPKGNKSNQDFDLYLYDEFSNIVAKSVNDQTTTNGTPPLETISYPPLVSGTYYIVIKKFSANVNVDFDLIVTGGYDLKSGYYTKTRSISGGVPGDSPFAFTVGAVGGNTVTPACDNNVLASYSSQGPTNDGRIKPDISAPTGVSTVTDGARNCSAPYAGGFEGTSSSAPHVAGISALVKQKFPSYTPSQIQSYIENNATDLGTVGKDNEFGYGRVQLDITPPNAVSNLSTSSPTANSIILNWTAVGDDANSGTAYSYDIRYSTANITDANWSSATQVTGEPTPKVAGSSESFTVTGLNPSTTYYFAIKADDELPNTSALSNVVSATTTALVPPTAPTNLSATTGNTQTILSWTASTAGTYSISGYNIYRSTTSGSGYAKVNTSVLTATNYIDTNLTNGTTYYYVVRAVDVYSTESSNSSEVFATPQDTTAPSAVTNLSATSPTTISITLNWTAVGDDANTGTATSYDIRYSTATITDANWSSATQVTGEPTPKTAGSSETFTVSGLSADTTYYFAIKVSDEVPNVSALSNIASTKTTFNLPSAPTNLSATGGNKQITLSWSTATAGTHTISGYNIYRSTTSGSSYTKINTSTVTTTNYTDTGLSSSTTYYYIVKTVDSKNNESANSSEVNAKTLDNVSTTLPSGISFISLPIQHPTDKNSSLMFSTSFVNLARYDATYSQSNPYHQYSDNPNDSYLQITAGEGYWLKLNSSQNIDVAGTFLTSAKTIHLYAGWNQIGNPFNFNVSYNDLVKFQRTGESQLNLYDAVNSGYLYSYLWSYSSGTYTPVYAKAPKSVPNAVTYIEPFKGYWIYAKYEGDLTIPATQKTKEKPKYFDGSLSLQINLKEGENIDTIYLGESKEKFTMLKPPSFENLPEIYFADTQNKNAGFFKENIEGEYNLKTECGECDKNITLNWDNTNLAETYNYTLIDEDIGKTINLSKENSYTFYPTDKLRNFKLTVSKNLNLFSASLILDKVVVFPNPITKNLEFNNLNIEAKFLSGLPLSAEIEIYNTSGKLICRENAMLEYKSKDKIKLSSPTLNNNILTLPNGTYFGRITFVSLSGEKLSKVVKLVVLK